MSHRALGTQFGDVDVNVDDVWPLRQHDEIASGKHPNLLEDIRTNGVKEPLEISVHPERGPVLRGGSHRLNAARALGIKSLKAKVYSV